MTAQIFRVIGQSLKQQGIFPKPEDVITTGGMDAHIEDKTRPGTNAVQFTGVRCAGHTWDITARGLVSENVNFVAIRCKDESNS